jgi:hypothetical protein
MKEYIASGKRVCLGCKKKDIDGAIFDGIGVFCCDCSEKGLLSQAAKRVAAKQAALPGELWCVRCYSYKKEDDFIRTYMNLTTNAKKQRQLSSCIPCTNDRLVGNAKQTDIQLYEDWRMQMADEKLEALQKIWDTSGSITGCCKDCPFNLKRMKTTCELLFNETQAKRIFSRLVEWDHNNPLSKTQQVSNIYNLAKRLAEIALCTLRCIFCHRLKTYKNGDGNYKKPSAERLYSRKYFQDVLTWKKIDLL